MPTRLRVAIVTLIRSRCPDLSVRADRPLSLTPQPAFARTLRFLVPVFWNSNSQTIDSPPQTGLVLTFGLSHCQRGADVKALNGVCPDGNLGVPTALFFLNVTVEGSVSQTFFPAAGAGVLEPALSARLFEKDGDVWPCAGRTASETQVTRPHRPAMNPTCMPSRRRDLGDESPPPGRRLFLIRNKLIILPSWNLRKTPLPVIGTKTAPHSL